MRTSILIVAVLVAAFYISTYPKEDAIILTGWTVGIGVTLYIYYIIGTIIIGIFKWAKKQ